MAVVASGPLPIQVTARAFRRPRSRESSALDRIDHSTVPLSGFVNQRCPSGDTSMRLLEVPPLRAIGMQAMRRQPTSIDNAWTAFSGGRQ